MEFFIAGLIIVLSVGTVYTLVQGVALADKEERVRELRNIIRREADLSHQAFMHLERLGFYMDIRDEKKLYEMDGNAGYLFPLKRIKKEEE